MSRIAKIALLVVGLLLASCSHPGSWDSILPTNVPTHVEVQPTPLTALWPMYAHFQELVCARAGFDNLVHVAGEPDQVQAYNEGYVYEYWPDDEREVFVNATLINGAVQLVSIVAWPGESLGGTADVLAGRQAQLVPLEDHPGRGDAVYAFPAEGFAVGVEGEMVTAIQYFIPTDDATYLNQWGRRPPWQVPFPSRLDVLLDLLRERHVAVGLARGSIENSLGGGTTVQSEPCQWTRYRVRSEDRIWSFEISILYSEQTAAAIDTAYLADERMTLADVIREFGVPDLVLGDPYDPMNQAALLTLVYLAEGIQITIGTTLAGSYDLVGEREEFGGEGFALSCALFGYRSAEEYLQAPCARSLRLGYWGETIPWETVNPFQR